MAGSRRTTRTPLDDERLVASEKLCFLDQARAGVWEKSRKNRDEKQDSYEVRQRKAASRFSA
jgi:hypothetical protein